jgi:catechol 2,3-dioxygenase
MPAPSESDVVDRRAAPAAPGTYGEAPSGYRLPDGTRLGPVRLQIADLARSVAYYEQVLGLRLAERSGRSAQLAAQGDGPVLVELHEWRRARPMVQRGRLGLYHFAVLLPDRPSLGRFARHLASLGVQPGAGDHLVSEAFYLRDPDGLGIEVYADRPRETWRRLGREILMATDPVDVEDLLRAAGESEWSGMPAGTVMGHVHLHVGSITDARRFFSDALGFDVMTASYPGALFLGAGGYHHHVGTNTWAGAGAMPARDADARLLEWTIVLPDASDVAAAARSVEAAGFAAELVDDAGPLQAITRDPSGTAIRIIAAPTLRNSA